MYEFTPNWTKNGKIRDHCVPLWFRKRYGIIPTMPNKGTFFLNRLNPTSLRSRATSRMYSDLTTEEQFRQVLRLEDRDTRISQFHLPWTSSQSQQVIHWHLGELIPPDRNFVPTIPTADIFDSQEFAFSHWIHGHIDATREGHVPSFIDFVNHLLMNPRKKWIALFSSEHPRRNQ